MAQLHQLRGRIGRGAHKSFCALAGNPKSKEGWQRLQIMTETTDGFRIAEEDFKIRGPGNIFGTEQSGLPPLRFASLETDYDLLTLARNDAARIIKEDLDPRALARPARKDAGGGQSGGVACDGELTSAFGMDSLPPICENSAMAELFAAAVSGVDFQVCQKRGVALSALGSWTFFITGPGWGQPGRPFV